MRSAVTGSMTDAAWRYLYSKAGLGCESGSGGGGASPADTADDGDGGASASSSPPPPDGDQGDGDKGAGSTGIIVGVAAGALLAVIAVCCYCGNKEQGVPRAMHA